jgi:hypothetical protein
MIVPPEIEGRRWAGRAGLATHWRNEATRHRVCALAKDISLRDYLKHAARKAYIATIH